MTEDEIRSEVRNGGPVGDLINDLMTRAECAATHEGLEAGKTYGRGVFPSLPHLVLLTGWGARDPLSEATVQYAQMLLRWSQFRDGNPGARRCEAGFGDYNSPTFHRRLIFAALMVLKLARLAFLSVFTPCPAPEPASIGFAAPVVLAGIPPPPGPDVIVQCCPRRGP